MVPVKVACETDRVVGGRPAPPLQAGSGGRTETLRQRDGGPATVRPRPLEDHQGGDSCGVLGRPTTEVEEMVVTGQSSLEQGDGGGWRGR